MSPLCRHGGARAGVTMEAVCPVLERCPPVKVLNVEATPNPHALKFVVDGRVTEGGARSFESPAEAEAHPLARALFGLGDVKTVFFMPSFVTVSKEPSTDWTELQPRIEEALAREAESGAPATARPASGATALTDTDLELLPRIEEVFETRVRPALAGDGGGLDIVSLENYTLTIRYQGACGSCPSSISGTLRAIEHMIRVDVDPGITVVSV
jgi:Fe-S cluster biogenesis protein NfuA